MTIITPARRPTPDRALTFEQAIAHAPAHVRSIEVPNLLPDIGHGAASIGFGLVWGGALALPGIAAGNYEWAAYGACVGIIAGSAVRLAALTLPRLNVNRATFNPVQPVHAQAHQRSGRFVQVAAHTMHALPDGWTIDMLHDFAMRCTASNYDMRYRSWVGAGLPLSRQQFDGLRDWLNMRGMMAENELTAAGRGRVRAWADGMEVV